jgi:predicted RNA binding protein YcfA (HicA-like mRNA interferase family)
LSRQGAGSHQLWINPRTSQRTVIAYHPAREVPPGTLRAILRQLGLRQEDLNSA